MRTFFILFFVIYSSVTACATNGCVELARICRSGNDNTIYWRVPISLSCGSFVKYKIHAKNTSAPIPSFLIIDSINNFNITSFIHTNAGLPAPPPAWVYTLEVVVDCGGSLQSCFSDTLSIDNSPPSNSFLDSVSVDVNTGSILLGWQQNGSPDFKYFNIYNSQKTPTPFVANTTNVFFIDNPTIPPDSIALEYDIAPLDSCNNRTNFGINPHTTMLLKTKIDTCKGETILFWSLYKGWPSIKELRVYRNINSAGFVLLAILGSNDTVFIDKNLPLQSIIKYFIRAFKNGTMATISSSSNAKTETTGKRIDSKSNYINYVTTNLGKIELSLNKDDAAIINRLDVQKSNDGVGFVSLTTISNAPSPIIINDLIANASTKNHYRFIDYNLCGLPNDTSNTSNNIVLRIKQTAGGNLLDWDSYFTWNTGIKNYSVFRETRIGTQITEPYSPINTSPNDTFYLDTESGGLPVGASYCYVVEALQNPGSPLGRSETSKSNEVCLLGQLSVYFPSAFYRDGTIQSFKPVGAYVDFKKSYLEIYDRWGAKLTTLKDLSVGWEGKGESGELSPSGVYFYRAFVFGIDGSALIKEGFVTLLN